MQDPNDINLEVVDARSREAIAAMESYFAELDERFTGGFDAGDTLVDDAVLFDPPTGAFVVVRVAGVVVGCGA